MIYICIAAYQAQKMRARRYSAIKGFDCILSMYLGTNYEQD